MIIHIYGPAKEASVYANAYRAALSLPQVEGAEPAPIRIEVARPLAYGLLFGHKEAGRHWVSSKLPGGRRALVPLSVTVEVEGYVFERPESHPHQYRRWVTEEILDHECPGLIADGISAEVVKAEWVSRLWPVPKAPATTSPDSPQNRSGEVDPCLGTPQGRQRRFWGGFCPGGGGVSPTHADLEGGSATGRCLRRTWSGSGSFRRPWCSRCRRSWLMVAGVPSGLPRSRRTVSRHRHSGEMRL